MKYSKHFAALINQFGTVNLEGDALKVFLNVIHFEAELKVYERLNQENRYLIKIHEINQKINSLTCGLEPKIFMQKLHDGELPKPSGESYLDGAKPWDLFDPYMTDIKKKY